MVQGSAGVERGTTGDLLSDGMREQFVIKRKLIRRGQRGLAMLKVVFD